MPEPFAAALSAVVEAVDRARFGWSDLLFFWALLAVFAVSDFLRPSHDAVLRGIVSRISDWEPSTRDFTTRGACVLACLLVLFVYSGLYVALIVMPANLAEGLRIFGIGFALAAEAGEGEGGGAGYLAPAAAAAVLLGLRNSGVGQVDRVTSSILRWIQAAFSVPGSVTDVYIGISRKLIDGRDRDGLLEAVETLRSDDLVAEMGGRTDAACLARRLHGRRGLEALRSADHAELRDEAESLVAIHCFAAARAGGTRALGRLEEVLGVRAPRSQGVPLGLPLVGALTLLVFWSVAVALAVALVAVDLFQGRAWPDEVVPFWPDSVIRAHWETVKRVSLPGLMIVLVGFALAGRLVSERAVRAAAVRGPGGGGLRPPIVLFAVVFLLCEALHVSVAMFDHGFFDAPPKREEFVEVIGRRVLVYLPVSVFVATALCLFSARLPRVLEPDAAPQGGRAASEALVAAVVIAAFSAFAAYVQLKLLWTVDEDDPPGGVVYDTTLGGNLDLVALWALTFASAALVLAVTRWVIRSAAPDRHAAAA